MTTKKLIKLSEHESMVYSILSLDEKTFAIAGTDGEVNIWEFEDYETIKCTKSINVLGNHTLVCPVVTPLSKDYIVIHLVFDCEFQVRNWKTLELLKIYKHDSYIKRLIVLKNNSIMTSSEDEKISLWRISE